MTALGYALSSEEHGPADLVRHAARAEQVGFDFALVSDHFHPWLDVQGHSPFVWTVLGAIAQRTERLVLGTGVTCPLIRMHPAIVAHAAATAAALLPGRFWLGVGTGENLNEHVTGARWPTSAVRREMLEEAVAVIRQLWGGEQVEHHGRHYTVENARLYTLPESPPPLHVAAHGPQAAELAGRIGDGLICVPPDADIVQEFDAAGGAGKPRIGQMHCCWGPDAAEARRTARELWSNSGVPGELSQELATPAHFEQVADIVREEDVCGSISCGPDLDEHLDSLRKYVEAGFDHVYVHQIGHDQDGFLDWAERELLPRAREELGAPAHAA